jgi:sulfoacetaldehyde dehydrogenase
MSDNSYVEGLVDRSRKAFRTIEFADQQTVDDICGRIAWQTTRDEFVDTIARQSYAIAGLGSLDAKYKKMGKIKAIYYSMKNARTCGIIDENPEEGIVAYAKPMGVIAALIPITNPAITPIIKTLWALKTRNSIVLAPHPRGVEINKLIAAKIHGILRENGMDPDLVLSVDDASIANSKALMEYADIVLATGGASMVKAAYESGTPAYGVGTGNAPVIIDGTMDLAESARLVKMSKTFDNASGCSADNHNLVYDGVYSDYVKCLQAEGGYLVRADSPEKQALQDTLWTAWNVLNRDIVARPAKMIAELAGIAVPDGTEFLMVEESGIGDDYPFSREKLCPVLTLYRWSDFDRAVDMVNELTGNCGAGHSCGIHTTDDGRARHLAEKARVARVTLRQAHALSNSGSWTNGLRQTCTLGCGTWGGGIASENVDFHHLLNITRLSYPLDRSIPDDEDIFGEYAREGK